MTEKVCLFIIDPQNDFCIDDPKTPLYVPGAAADSERLGRFINKNLNNLEDIQITLDSHHRVHVAHAISWVDAKGKHPDNFSVITYEDMLSGKYRARNPGFQDRYLSYTKALKDNGKYILMIWPEHCLIGTPGAAVVKPVWEALYNWESQYAVVGKTTKGSNLYTEHYSAVRADVEDDADPMTKLNRNLISLIREYDRILISGQALSHCLANTISDIAEEFSDEDVKKFTLLEDTSSAVVNCEGMALDFVQRLIARGMQVSTTQTYKFQ